MPLERGAGESLYPPSRTTDSYADHEEEKPAEGEEDGLLGASGGASSSSSRGRKPARPLALALSHRRRCNFVDSRVLVALALLSVLALLAKQRLAPGRRDTAAQHLSPHEPWREEHEADVPLTKAQLQAMVGPTPRFLVKDNGWSFGFNNVRYMAESTLAFGQIMYRIPIIAETIWARECAVASEVCAKYALKYIKDRNHDPEIGAGWNDDGEAFKLSISEFIDMPHFRKTFGPVLTAQEFFLLHDMPTNLTGVRGLDYWDESKFTPPNMTKSNINSDDFERDQEYVRVDRPPPPKPVSEGESRTWLEEVLRNLRGDRKWISMEKARRALAQAGVGMPSSDSDFIKMMESAGQTTLYTFSDQSVMNHALAFPSYDFAPDNDLRFLTYMDPAVQILSFHGGYHDQRRPGAVRYTTAAMRASFADVVMRAIRPPKRYHVVAALIAERMQDKVHGRKWMAAHLRRGDFVQIGWASDTSYQSDLGNVQKAFKVGVEKMREHNYKDLPNADDPFFLATDDTSPESLAYYRSQGALLLADLLTPSDLIILGWQGSFAALRALAEQLVLSHADYFVGSFMSSTTGGALNMRAVRGHEAWTSGTSQTRDWMRE